MFKRRILSGLTALVSIVSLSGMAAAAEVDCDSVYCFSAEDFSAEASITGVCITSVPEQGTVLLDSRVICVGDVLTAEQVARMTFAPALTEADETVQVGYLPVLASGVEEEASMTIGIRGKENKVPVAEDSALETYKNLEVTGKLKVSDPEGEALAFTVARQPKRGSVAIREDGTFTYTPKKNKVGIDSFAYTATDASGKVSREATVTITILKPTESEQYTDTAGRECRFAAEWMKNTGIFVGETIGDTACFGPEKEVTRGEFVTMLVRALELETDETVTYTGYTDDIPDWLQPYLAAAVRSGLTAGLPEQEAFGADTPITAAEAATMLRNALDETVETLAAEDETILTRAEAAMVLYEAAQRNASDTYGV